MGTKFLELGPDQAQVNELILSFAMKLERKRKEAMAEGESADSAAPGAAKLKSLTDLQEKIMLNLSTRKELSPISLIWIVKTTKDLGTDSAREAAGQLIEKIIDRKNEDQNFERQIGPKAITALESLGATIQAEQGHYDKAQGLIDQLIQKFPRALEPRISEAKILTEWAAKDPAKYADAINKWDTLRNRLERMSANPDPKKIEPKYEVIWNEAECFYRMSQKTKSKDDAKKGLDLLMPYLKLDDKIINPSDEYKDLSGSYFQLGYRLADFLGVPRPIRPKVKRPHAP